MEDKPLETNSDLIRLALEVLKNYALTPENLTVVQSGTIKTVWKFKSGNKLFCLKRLKQSLDKALFSVYAQIFIKNAGGKVPALILAKDNQALVQYKDQLFTVYEWINGKDLDFGKQDDLSQAVMGLAEFHNASTGYKPAEASRVSSKLGKWPEQYLSMQSKMKAWKIEAEKSSSVQSNAAYIKYVDSISDISETAMKLLAKSDYGTLTAGDLSKSSRHVLCHQDYGRGNALLTDNGIYVIDLDGVTFDLPARDLRKLIGKNAENKGHWDAGSIKNFLEWYTCINPMSEKEKEVLYIDLLFPHWFFGLVKNQFLNGKQLKAAEIERIAKLEKSKLPVLYQLLEFHPKEA